MVANMTPYKHAQSSVAKWGGTPEDYIELHDWFDETKMFTGDWTHRALRHHSAGIQWAIQISWACYSNQVNSRTAHHGGLWIHSYSQGLSETFDSKS